MACLSHDNTNVLIFVSNVLILNLFFKPTCYSKVNVMVYTYYRTIFYEKKNNYEQNQSKRKIVKYLTTT